MQGSRRVHAPRHAHGGQKWWTLVVGNGFVCHFAGAYVKWGLILIWVEAGCFAWLAQRRLDNLTGNLPEVTGASRKAILGAVYDPCRPL